MSKQKGENSMSTINKAVLAAALAVGLPLVGYAFYAHSEDFLRLGTAILIGAGFYLVLTSRTR